MMWQRFNVGWVWAVLLAAALAACTRLPAQQYAELAESGGSLLRNTQTTYAKIIQLQRRFLVTAAPNATLTKDTFKPVISGVNFDLRPELQFRESALELISSYLSVLGTLAIKDYTVDLDAASMKLAESAKGFEQMAAARVAEMPKLATAFATLSNAVGRQIGGQMRKDALATAMDTAQPSLDALSKLMTQSNEKLRLATDLMLNRMLAHANTVRPRYASIDRYQFDLEYAQLIDEVDDIQVSLQKVSASINQLAETHRSARRLLDSDMSSGQALKGLTSEAKKLRSFYKTIE